LSFFFFFKQKTAYEMVLRDWSSDVCSSDLGAFERGDAVIIRGPDGTEIGRGLCAFDVEDARKIRGRASGDIDTILGFSGRAEMVHRDDLVVSRD
jgi:glutamate 5-kinase